MIKKKRKQVLNTFKLKLLYVHRKVHIRLFYKLLIYLTVSFTINRRPRVNFLVWLMHVCLTSSGTHSIQLLPKMWPRRICTLKLIKLFNRSNVIKYRSLKYSSWNKSWPNWMKAWLFKNLRPIWWGFWFKIFLILLK